MNQKQWQCTFHAIKKIILPISIFLSAPLFSQTIFPNLTGQELLDSLVADFKTGTVLPLSNAKDTLFAKIYAVDDSLRAVYTGYTIYLDPTQDPSQYAFSQGINTEHTYPKSKGATGQAESDMHHLYPTREVVNSVRGNDPFAEIPDTDTDRWFRLNVILNTIPNQFIDEYSEKDDDTSLFELREDHEGNAARAIFYFYTMYEQEANNADPQFFPIQKNTLYQWHMSDPVDSSESIRNDKIAFYQGGKKNPFILDSSLVRRAYFTSAQSINNKRYITAGFELQQNYPNPFNPTTSFGFRIPDYGLVTLKVYDITGREVATIVSENLAAGSYNYEWNASEFASGIYFYRIQTDQFVDVKKMVLAR